MKYIRDVSRHGEGNGFSRKVEANSKAHVRCASPINFDIVEELESGDVMVGSFDGSVLDAEVVDDEGLTRCIPLQ